MARPMNYKDEETELWDDFLEYRDSVLNSPRIKVEYVGRNGDKVETPLRVPLTAEGFENFVYNKREFSIHDYLYSTNERYTKFSTIRSRIKRFIRQDQIEGGMVGQYNASITQRLNGLTDKSESSVTVGGPIFKGINLDVSEDNSTSEDSGPKS